jgi:hypothetical protein
MCWVWNIGSFRAVSVLTDGPRKPNENACAADTGFTFEQLEGLKIAEEESENSHQ